MSISIETDVPMPTKNFLPKIPFEAMEGGHSCLGPTPDRKAYLNVAQAVQRFQKKNPPKRFSLRKEDKDSVRVFRVEDNEPAEPARPSGKSPVEGQLQSRRISDLSDNTD